MAFIIKSQRSNIFWTGEPNSVWTDQLVLAKKYESTEDAELDLEEKASQYGYIVQIIDESDVVFEEAPVEEAPVEEAPVEEDLAE